MVISDLITELMEMGINKMPLTINSLCNIIYISLKHQLDIIQIVHGVGGESRSWAQSCD